MTDDEKPLSRIEGECLSEGQDLRGVRNEIDWRFRYEQETRIVDNVWAALNISTCEQAQGKDIATLVSERRADSEILRHSNIIEIAVRNQSGSVSDYMKHWEGRALKAEAEAAELRTLAQIGTWHKDCRPNRHMAARELQKSQAIINQLADTITELRACLAASRPGEPWQPMETMPESGQVIVCWSSRHDFDTIGRDEYIEIIGLGEKPALGWIQLPAPPKDEK